MHRYTYTGIGGDTEHLDKCQILVPAEETNTGSIGSMRISTYLHTVGTQEYLVLANTRKKIQKITQLCTKETLLENP